MQMKKEDQEKSLGHEKHILFENCWKSVWLKVEYDFKLSWHFEAAA